MDLSQVTPELSGHSFNPAAPGYNSDADSQTYGSLAADNSTQAHPNTGSAGVSLQPVFVNFAPVVTGDIAGNVHEDIHLISTGSLNISDRNTGDQDTVTLNNGNGACGTLAIDQQGHWAYQLDNTNPIVEALGAGEHLTEHFTISVTDSHGAVVDKQITITVDGTNDLPVISGVHAGTLVEGATQEASGQLTG